jgi:hypothetical protein
VDAEVMSGMGVQEKGVAMQVNYYFSDKNYFKDEFI